MSYAKETNKCELCGYIAPNSTMEYEHSLRHDSAIVRWLNADSHQGDTNGRAYYAYKRREKKDYKGFRRDVWEMMHTPVHTW